LINGLTYLNFHFAMHLISLCSVLLTLAVMVNGTCKCGIANTRNGNDYIMNGKPTKENQYPWMVGLTVVEKGKREKLYCGGSLIDDRTVLTAAHCLCDRKDKRTGKCTSFISADRLGVWVGLHDWRVTDEGQEHIGVEKWRKHWGYQKNSRYDNDLALLKLNKRVEWRTDVQPLCLPKNKSQIYEGERATVIGWGKVSYIKLRSNWFPNKLREADVKIISNKQCKKIYGGITDNMLCTYEGNGGKDACVGDSGGPLFVERKGVEVNGKKQYEQIGVVSSGAPCGTRKDPAGVYAKVTARLDWIKKYMYGKTCH